MATPSQYNANLGYDMPGSGKCVMEYAMRLFAVRSASRGVNCNVVIPGIIVPAGLTSALHLRRIPAACRRACCRTSSRAQG